MARQRALLFAVSREPLDELEDLLRTAGGKSVGQVIQGRAEADPDYYLGQGKILELEHRAKTTEANLLVCNDELSPRQERNLEQRLGVAVLDRTALILDIFALHAQSAAGKLQVEIAQIEYNMARMRGLWPHLERLGPLVRGPERADLASATALREAPSLSQQEVDLRETERLFAEARGVMEKIEELENNKFFFR